MCLAYQYFNLTLIYSIHVFLILGIHLMICHYHH